jgi:hypothetical protein
MALATAILTSGATLQFGTVPAGSSTFTAGNMKIAGSATIDGQLEVTAAAAVVVSASVLAVTSSGTVSITANNAIQAAGSAVLGGSVAIPPATSGSLSAGGGMLVKDETSGTNWFLHVHGDRVRLYNGSTELVFIATTDTIATASNALACSGNSATATLASTATIAYDNRTASNFQILFGSSTGLYGSDLVTMNPSTGTITTTNIDGAARGGTISGFSRVYNAVWNDYADYISLEGPIPVVPGRVYVYNGHFHQMASSYAEMGAIGICSDTFSFVAGYKDSEFQVPIAVCGFVLAYVDKVYPSGTPLTSAADGGLTEMSLETKMKYPERMLATFYKEERNVAWHGVKINGRHWVQVR